MPTLYHLYYLNFARTALQVTDKHNLPVYYANLDVAKAEAAARSMNAPYPIFVDTNGSLHNTRDGKSVEGV